MPKENDNLLNEEESLFSKLIAKYLPYWPFFVISILLGGVGAWAYLKTTVPIYEASATLIIKDEKKGSEDSKLMESLDLISSKKIVENEVEVLQSRKLMKDVADKLNLYTPIYQEFYWKKRLAYYYFPVLAITLNPESLTLGQDIPISFDEKTDEVILNGKDRIQLDKPVSTPYGELVFIKNKKFQGYSGDGKFFLSVYPSRYLVPSLQANLKVQPAGRLSSLVKLYYRDQIPERSESILNQLIYSYREAEVAEKNKLAKNTLDFVNERLGLIAKDLDTIQKKVQAFKSGSNAVDIGTQGQLYLQNVSENDQKLSEVNTQLSVLSQVEKYVNSNNSDAIIPTTLGVSDPVLGEMLTKLNNLELDYEKGKATIGENNPRLLEVKEQINKLRPNILQNIEGQRRSLTITRDNINATNRQYSSILSRVPQKERQLIDITRDEQNKRSTYEFLLQKKEESELAYSSTVADNKIVDSAEASNRPVWPKKKVIYLSSFLCMMILSMAVISIREALNRKVMYRRDIEAITKIPVIAEINREKASGPFVIKKGERSLIAEQFRKLRLSLSFMGVNEDHKRILLTSSISGEGKSFVAANLAISLTLTGKKVVIVDTDLNKPTQGKMFGMESFAGVADFLMGKGEAIDYIHEVPEYENLHLIPAGNLPDNPTELLLGERTKELIDYLSLVFDYVIIDTSPIGLVTDGYLITSLCDATLFVVRHDYTPKIFIKRIDESNMINPIKNPGIIFNGLKQRGYVNTKYGYGYGYDYIYAYGYGKGEGKKKRKDVFKGDR
ncbi:MAG: polysaccharide biosynthesis tyrosine autokinase [Chitinophagaceae bacterium]|nr:polysaccharide biosynthesis tyrosine autokinase [Chitinophagaceae bacterium]